MLRNITLLSLTIALVAMAGQMFSGCGGGGTGTPIVRPDGSGDDGDNQNGIAKFTLELNYAAPEGCTRSDVRVCFEGSPDIDLGTVHVPLGSKKFLQELSIPAWAQPDPYTWSSDIYKLVINDNTVYGMQFLEDYEGSYINFIYRLAGHEYELIGQVPKNSWYGMDGESIDGKTIAINVDSPTGALKLPVKVEASKFLREYTNLKLAVKKQDRTIVQTIPIATSGYLDYTAITVVTILAPESHPSVRGEEYVIWVFEDKNSNNRLDTGEREWGWQYHVLHYFFVYPSWIYGWTSNGGNTYEHMVTAETIATITLN